ncbi:MAG TPA: glycine betaine/L-proline ABC transporter ATP-binding protein [Acidimicrobiia bacterium]|nr:glycine betaine/L-proline ABC transporter ATP-binding protein [Acidimicrobiia bacterium]
MTDICIEVENCWKVFGGEGKDVLQMAEAGRSRADILEATGATVAVRDVSFEVERGETFVVMGLSGSGKSTLVRCVARLSDPTRGRVVLDGEDLTAMDEATLREVRRKKLSMVFQHFGLFPHRRVIDNVAYGLEVQGLSKTERRARAGEILEVVGLEGWGDHYPQQLSGGMQQRVGLARALAVDPEVLFFDEPFSALDPLIRRDMQDELIGLQERLHRTIVFITHDFAEAIKLGDRIAIMKDGSFDQVGTAAELIADPRTDYVREFTKDIPKVKVVTAGAIATGPSPAGNGLRRVAAGDTVEMILPALLDDPSPIEVVADDGQLLGCVDRDAVIRLLEA